VTAEKRSERLQDVPLAITGITANDLHELNAQDFTDYARTIPGLSFTDLGDGRERVSMRGLAATTGTPTVAYYIGETPMPPARGNLARAQLDPTLVDIERIEVLRGPQGTLYGASSEGGTIRLIPTAPNTHQYSGFIESGGGWTQGGGGAGNASFAANAPLIPDLLAVRAAAWYREDQGFIKRLVGPEPVSDPAALTLTNSHFPDEQAAGFRVTALWTPSDIGSVSAMIYSETHHASGFEDITGGASNPNDALKQIMLTNTPEPQSNRFNLFDLTGKLTLGNVALTSTSSYYRGRMSTAEEGAAFIQSLFGGNPFPNRLDEIERDDSFTQEIRAVTVNPIAGFSGILGGYYNNVDGNRTQTYSPAGWNATFAPDGPGDPLYSPNNNLFTLSGLGGGPGVEKYGEIAEFGELTYAFTSQVKLTGGVRHYDIHNSQAELLSGLFEGGIVPEVNRGKFTGNVYKANLSYDYVPNHLVYAQFAEGFRPGYGIYTIPTYCAGDLTAIGVTSVPTKMNPDTDQNFEIGSKNTWLDQRVSLNAAGYSIRWKNIEQSLLLPCGFSFDANAGSATSNGIELESEAKLTPQIEVGGSASYTHATLNNNEPNFGALRGDQLLDVPVWQYAAHVKYSFVPLGSTRESVRIDVQHNGTSYADYSRLAGTSERDPASQLGPLTELGARFGMVSGPWDIALVGANLCDASARVGRQSSLIADVSGRPRYVINRPRTIMIDIRKSF